MAEYPSCEEGADPFGLTYDLSALMGEVIELGAEVNELGRRARDAEAGDGRRRRDMAIQPCRAKRILPFALRGIEGAKGRYEIFLPNNGAGLVRVGLHPLGFGGYFADSSTTPTSTVIPADGWLDIGDTWDAAVSIDVEDDCWTLHRMNNGWGNVWVNSGSFDTIGLGVMEWGFAWPEQTYRELGDTEDYRPIVRDEPCGVCFKCIDAFSGGPRYDHTTHTSWDELCVDNSMVYLNRFGVIVKTKKDAGGESFILQ
jgi:hypothetical protein